MIHLIQKTKKAVNDSLGMSSNYPGLYRLWYNV